MELSSAGWHPPLYVSCSFLLMFLFPLFVIPVLRGKQIWFSTAPSLLTLMPLVLSTTLGYVGVRNVFEGMARGGGGTAAIAAGLAEIHWCLKFGSIFSGMALLVAFGIAIWRSRRSHDVTSPTIGRRTAFAIIAATLILFGGVVMLSFVAFRARSDFDVLERLYAFVLGGAWASAALLIVTIVIVVRLVRSAPAVAGADPQMLLVPLTILIVSGGASWFIEQWFLRIARYGL